jgi:type VI secretion system FHA domain protein
MTVFLGVILVAEITLSVKVDSTQRQKSGLPVIESSQARRYRRIFASYSHEDLEIVQQVANYASGLGDRYLTDVTDLRSGEVWSKQLEKLIEEADIFQLFWSWDSMCSPFVTNEWRYALSLNRTIFVRPCYWQEPLPRDQTRGLPPHELQELHFHRICVHVPDQSPSTNHIRDHIEGSPHGDSFVPPEVAPAEPTQTIPQDFDIDDLFSFGGETGKQSDDAGETAEIFPEPPRMPPPAAPIQAESVPEVTEKPRESLPEDYGDLFNEFFKAAGIEDTSLLPRERYPELMQTVGAVFKELIDGLMTVLRARTELKSQFRVSVTTIQPVENNPLKFSPTVHEALKLLLAEKQPGFVDGVNAVREGYQDIMNHQLAITAAIQASLMSLVSRFDPQKFARKYEERIVLQKKAKCWDAYRQAYRDIAREALENFFGEEFARAYEEQMSKLRTTRKKS